MPAVYVNPVQEGKSKTQTNPLPQRKNEQQHPFKGSLVRPASNIQFAITLKVAVVIIIARRFMPITPFSNKLISYYLRIMAGSNF